ncbi:Class I glutamine amidotransferase-like protein [Elaphomyces granulatus]
MASTASIRPGRPVHFHMPLFPCFQLLDTAGPLDILNVCSQFSETADITLTLLAATLDPVPVKPIPPVNANYRFDVAGKYLSEKVNITFNQSLVPDLTFSEYLLALDSSSIAEKDGGKYKPIDVLIIPGGIGTRLDRLYPPQPGSKEPSRVSNIQETKEFIMNVAPYIRHSIITVCTGSHVLAQTGLLDGRSATTNSGRFDLVASHRPQVKWLRNRRWVRSLPREKVPDVDNGMKVHPDLEIWTSAGITAGMDITLAFIAEYFGGIDFARSTARILEYEWTGDGGETAY